MGVLFSAHVDDTEKNKSAFEAITTQEALDKIVESRLARERAEYTGFEDFKAKAAKLDETVEELNTARKQRDKAFGEVEVMRKAAELSQVTMRFSEEVVWADEDYQLEVLAQVADAGQVALSRALDLGMFHRINPLTGQPIESWDNYILSTSKTVEQATADADDDFRAAVGLLVNASPSWGVNGAFS